MKHSLKALLIILLFTTSCNSLKPLPDKTVEIRYGNVNFTPKQIIQETANDFEVKVEPIDASNLNNLSSLAAIGTGDYEREVIDSYYERANNQDLSRDEKRRIEHLIELTDIIKEEVSDNTISSNLGYDLIDRMWGNNDNTKDGSEVNAMENKGNPLFNPYYDGSNYLSVFKLEMQNRSNQVQTLAFDNFQVSSGSEILYPRNTEYFEESLNNSLKIENAFRFNFPQELNVAPKQNVVKYLAIPPINQQEDSLSVQYIDENYDVTIFKFSQNISRTNNAIRFKNFVIHPNFFEFANINRHDLFYSVEFSNGYAFPLLGNNFFVPKDNLDRILTICGVAVPKSRSGSEPDFQCHQATPAKYEGGVIKLSN